MSFKQSMDIHDVEKISIGKVKDIKLALDKPGYQTLTITITDSDGNYQRITCYSGDTNEIEVS